MQFTPLLATHWLKPHCSKHITCWDANQRVEKYTPSLGGVKGDGAAKSQGTGMDTKRREKLGKVIQYANYHFEMYRHS